MAAPEGGGEGARPAAGAGADWGDLRTADLGAVVGLAVAEARGDLEALALGLQGRPPGERRGRLLGHLAQTRQRLLRLRALLAWARTKKPKYVRACLRVLGHTGGFSRRCAAAADALAAVHDEVQALRQPLYDVGTASDVLCRAGDVVFPEVVAATFPADPEGKGGGAGDLAAVGAVLRRELLRGLPGDCLAFPSSEGLARVEGPGGGFEAHITFIPERGGGAFEPEGTWRILDLDVPGGMGGGSALTPRQQALLRVGLEGGMNGAEQPLLHLTAALRSLASRVLLSSALQETRRLAETPTAGGCFKVFQAGGDEKSEQEKGFRVTYWSALAKDAEGLQKLPHFSLLLRGGRDTEHVACSYSPEIPGLGDTYFPRISRGGRVDVEELFRWAAWRTVFGLLLAAGAMLAENAVMKAAEAEVEMSCSVAADEGGGEFVAGLQEFKARVLASHDWVGIGVNGPALRISCRGVCLAKLVVHLQTGSLLLRDPLELDKSNHARTIQASVAARLPWTKVVGGDLEKLAAQGMLQYFHIMNFEAHLAQLCVVGCPLGLSQCKLDASKAKGAVPDSPLRRAYFFDLTRKTAAMGRRPPSSQQSFALMITVLLSGRIESFGFVRYARKAGGKPIASSIVPFPGRGLSGDRKGMGKGEANGGNRSGKRKREDSTEGGESALLEDLPSVWETEKCSAAMDAAAKQCFITHLTVELKSQLRDAHVPFDELISTNGTVKIVFSLSAFRGDDAPAAAGRGAEVPVAEKDSASVLGNRRGWVFSISDGYGSGLPGSAGASVLSHTSGPFSHIEKSDSGVQFNYRTGHEKMLETFKSDLRAVEQFLAMLVALRAELQKLESPVLLLSTAGLLSADLVWTPSEADSEGMAGLPRETTLTLRVQQRAQRSEAKKPAAPLLVFEVLPGPSANLPAGFLLHLEELLNTNQVPQFVTTVCQSAVPVALMQHAVQLLGPASGASSPCESSIVATSASLVSLVRQGACVCHVHLGHKPGCVLVLGGDGCELANMSHALTLPGVERSGTQEKAGSAVPGQPEACFSVPHAALADFMLAVLRAQVPGG